jgi:hypothetical protein
MTIITRYIKAIDRYAPHLDALGIDKGRLLLELLWREDASGDGKPCGGGWISKRKKCSKKSLAKLTASLKAGDQGAISRVQSGKGKAAARQKLAREVARDKGKKAKDIPGASDSEKIRLAKKEKRARDRESPGIGLRHVGPSYKMHERRFSGFLADREKAVDLEGRIKEIEGKKPSKAKEKSLKRLNKELSQAKRARDRQFHGGKQTTLKDGGLIEITATDGKTARFQMKNPDYKKNGDGKLNDSPVISVGYNHQKGELDLSERDAYGYLSADGRKQINKSLNDSRDEIREISMFVHKNYPSGGTGDGGGKWESLTSFSDRNQKDWEEGRRD